MPHMYSLRSCGAVREREPPIHSNSARPKVNKTKSGQKRSQPEHAQIAARYRGTCRYQLGYRKGKGTGGKGGSTIVQQDRILADTAALTDFCNRVLQHGYSGSMGGKGSRVKCPDVFCEAVKAGEISIDNGDRVAVVFSKTGGRRMMRVVEVSNTDSGYVVRFCKPHEKAPRRSFESGYGSFSLAVLKNLAAATAKDFSFESVDADGKEYDDYVEKEEEESEESEESEEESEESEESE